MAKGIYKRRKIYWIRYSGLDGKTVYESSGSEKFDKAHELYISRKNAIKEGKQPEISKIENHSFKELSEKYLQWINGRHLSAVTKAYRINDLVSHFGSFPLRRFNALIAEQYQTELMNRGLKPASVNKNISILKAVFRKAVDWNMVEEETLKYIRRVKNLAENNRSLRYLSKEECQTLLSTCKGHLEINSHLCT
ncbi:hypothetical protein NBG4_60043 [Candidatus Sulfobium mesophilum]|uniref:Core-binding (CB) domain-containing protein n=1 Tax=Candidatus Sulfobium mesophilum TaxID=2016548 RepID=A0A2U3QJI2_9BACT|nr:hypothetical protein NBG4_60043 [Candidatus Sulfobium mesophilum]